MTRTGARLLVVDDEESVRTLLLNVLGRAGYLDLTPAASAEEARGILAAEETDLVITDMQMPGGSGLGLLEHVHENLPGVATLMVTGTDDAGLADKALALGAYGYIIKPFRMSEILIGVSNALRRRDLELENGRHRNHLEEMVKTRTEDLWETIVKLEVSEKSVTASRSETIYRLAVAGEFHDEDTGSHVIRMSRSCEILARESGHEALSKVIREAASLHDVGKIGVQDSVLLKPGPLLPEERALMQKHSEFGHAILKDSESPLLRLAAEIALTHHERIDGSGYPSGLVANEISIAGRIAAIADVFDALTSDRIYRRAYPLVEAVDMMKADSGTHFDADLLSVFWDVLPEILTVQDRYRSERAMPDPFASQRARRIPLETSSDGPRA